MSARVRALLREERGQSLVFFVLTMTALFGMLALVVNVGAWLQAQRKAQVVADTAALAAAQGSAQGFTVAEQNWPGVTLSPPDLSGSTATQTRVMVTAERDVPALFGGLIGIVDFTVHARALARSEAVGTVNNIAPIALECKDPDPGGPSCDSWAIGSTVDFQYRRQNFGSLGPQPRFGPIRLPGMSTSTTGWANYLRCDPLAPSAGNCNATDASAPNSFPRLNLFSSSVRDALDPVVGLPPRLVAIFDSYSGGNFDLIGWAAFSITDVTRDSGSRIVTLTGTFQSMFLDSTRMSSNGTGGGQYDFGVRTAGLTG